MHFYVSGVHLLCHVINRLNLYFLLHCCVLMKREYALLWQIRAEVSRITIVIAIQFQISASLMLHGVLAVQCPCTLCLWSALMFTIMCICAILSYL
jgi:hypothetical protein